MTDDATTTARAAPPDAASSARHCPWCSEVLPVEATVRCPHCYANLVAEAAERLPGLTEVEPVSTTKARRADSPKRSKLLSWISGEVDDVASSPLDSPSVPDAVALPPRDVRREMLRLQLEAEGLTVTPDGEIELPARVTGGTPPSAGATADAPAGTGVSDQIQKAS